MIVFVFNPFIMSNIFLIIQKSIACHSPLLHVVILLYSEMSLQRSSECHKTIHENKKLVKLKISEIMDHFMQISQP